MKTRFARFGVAAAGTGALIYGALLAWQLGAASWLALAEWLAGGVIAHDLLPAPIVVALGVLASWVLPAYARGPVAVAAVIWGTLTVVAIPVLGGFGVDPTIPSLLDRPYVSAWLVLTGLWSPASLRLRWYADVPCRPSRSAATSERGRGG